MASLQTAFAATTETATAGLFAQMFNERMGSNMTTDTAKDTTAPAPTDTAAPSGGIDYSKEKEITQDEMTDELFAAVKRGDTDMVRGLTSGGTKNTGVKNASGATLLIAAAQENKHEMAHELMTYKGIDFGAMTDAGLTAAMLFQANGNKDIARLLIAKIQTNALMSQEGLNGDEQARALGANGLSESIKQAQRDDFAVEEEAAHQDAIIARNDKSGVSDTIRKWFGGGEEDTITAIPLANTNEGNDPQAAAAPATFVSKFANYFQGISSRFFGPKGPEAMPTSAADMTPSPLTAQGAVKNFLNRLGPSI